MNFDFSEQTKRYLEGQSARDFPIDVFISHNQEDSSRVFTEQLIEKGLTVWYDQYSDLTDGKVRTVILNSLRISRFVVLCIEGGFRDSQWCRAEYLPALEAENNVGIPRVLVALLDEDATIPPHLSTCKRFHIYKDSVKPLVRFVKAENFVTSHHLNSQAQVGSTSKIDRITKSLDYIIRTGIEPFFISKESDVGEFFLKFARRGDTFNDELILMSLREILYDSTSFEIRKIKENELLAPALLLFARKAYLLASRSDMRANALYIALWAGLIYPNIASRRTILTLIWRESNIRILEQAQTFAEYLLECVSASYSLADAILKEERDIRLILEAMNKRISRISGNERLRLYLVNQPVLQNLSFLERTQLWSNRLAYVCKSETERSEINTRDYITGSTIYAALLFNISTTELALRELHEIFFTSPRNPGIARQFGDEEKEIFSVVTDALEEFITISERNQGKPLVLAEEYYIDTLLDVFTVLIASKSTYNDGCLRLAERAHTVLEKHASEKISREAPNYTAYLQEIAQGTDRIEARSRFIRNLRLSS